MSPVGGRTRDRLFVGMQHLLPQHALSRAMCALARVRVRPVKNLLIRAFLRWYPVDLAEAEHASPAAYESFNAFFTRALRPGARAIEPAGDAVVCPVDGTVSQRGHLAHDRLLQAKGIEYTAAALLDDPQLAREFEGGSFATLYLAPYNYHRIHMPLAGTLRCGRYVPGDLFSVNATTAAGVPGLFARNERIVLTFDTAAGPLAVVLVGALFVGSIGLAWADVSRPARAGELQFGAGAVRLAKGEELGRFNMGSTVILLFPPSRVRLADALSPGAAVRMGQRLATIVA